VLLSHKTGQKFTSSFYLMVALVIRLSPIFLTDKSTTIGSSLAVALTLAWFN